MTEKFKEYFYELCKIPHGSYNESAIADYVLKVCLESGADAYKDEYNNVFASVPASPGREGEGAILLDSHLDMVCVENDGKNRDFTKTPIEAYEDGDFITARGTSLGGDDGAGVVMMLCLLTEDFSHPPLELLFTTSEEVGMDGAAGFDYKNVKARTVINIDSETESEVVIGCAGGELATFTVTEERKMPCPFKTIKITIKDLAGGHSGVEIDLVRKNANRLLGDLLSTLYDKRPFALVSVQGGERDNVITPSASATIAVDKREEALDILKKRAAEIYATLSPDDENMKIYFDEKGEAGESFTYAATSKVISLLTLVPYGVIDRYPDSFPKTSANAGIVKTEGNRVIIHYSLRSAVVAELEALETKLRRLAKAIGCELLLDGRHPGWDSGKKNALAEKYAEKYREKTGREIKITKIHAGVECGLIYDAIGGGDVISIGPDIFDIHSPDERLSISSCERVYDTLRDFISEY